jgi:sarcosine oxidase subunit beta|tara:strand:+ start:218 stop:364 length:147 start_codon:yes stop_codon:yes gene_type:complete
MVACSIAFALSKRGLRTLNIDALPAAGYRSTDRVTEISRTDNGIEEQP